MYPATYYDGNKPVPENIDQQILDAHKNGVQTVVLLFEYYGEYRKLPGAPNQLGDEEKWHSIGKAFAERFAPGSAWLKENEISGWGVTIYEAFNEPDLTPAKDAIPLDQYVAALRGLAAGIHQVDSRLAVIPGGFARMNANSDALLNGFGPALAALWNDGTLDGIDLHTYNDILYAPIITKDDQTVFQFSPQANFDAIRRPAISRATSISIRPNITSRRTRRISTRTWRRNDF